MASTVVSRAQLAHVNRWDRAVKLNVFRVELDDVDGLMSKLLDSGMEEVHTGVQDGWHDTFYYSTTPRGGSPNWAKPYAAILTLAGQKAYSTSPYAAHVFVKDTECLVLSYGRSHFYIRPYCDYDYGTDIAKRIADEHDTRQTSGKRFAGKRRKDIKSYANQSGLPGCSRRGAQHDRGGAVRSRLCGH